METYHLIQTVAVVNYYIHGQPHRTGGLLKINYESQLSFEQTHQRVADSIAAYNGLRPHGNCNYLTPNMAHLQTGELKKRWKNYPKKMIAEQLHCSFEEAGRLHSKNKHPPLLYGEQNNGSFKKTI